MTEAETAAADALLAQRDFKQLAPADAERFAGRRPDLSTDQLIPYIVRGVEAAPLSGFGAYWYGDSLVIGSGTVGCLAPRNRPLVVYLEHAPAKIFVTADAID